MKESHANKTAAKFIKLKKVDTNKDLGNLGFFSDSHTSSHLFDSTNSSHWEKSYIRGTDGWSTLELTDDLNKIFNKYVNLDSKILEVGCGTAVDLISLTTSGYKITGLDWSEEAIRIASQKANELNCQCSLLQKDFFSSNDLDSFDMIYDKGFFHNLKTDGKKRSFIEKIVQLLNPNGFWINISGSADSNIKNHPHGRLFLTDIIKNVEPYFEIIEIFKTPYGKIKNDLSFPAWFCVFQKR